MKKQKLKSLRLKKSTISRIDETGKVGARNPLHNAAVGAVIRVAYVGTNCNTCGDHLGQDTCLICGLTDNRTGDLCSLPI